MFDRSPKAGEDSYLIKETLTAIEDVIPYWLKFIAWVWNLLVALLQKIGLFPVFKRNPWLFFVLIFFGFGPIIPVGMFLVLFSLDVLQQRTWIDNDFVIHFETPEEILNDILCQMKDKSITTQDVYEAAINIGCPLEVASKIELLYAKETSAP